MNRRHFINSGATALGVLALSNDKHYFFQQGWKITMLTDEIGIFTERGGTVGFLLSKDGIVVIDAQFPEQATHLIGELKKKSEKPFKLLINTHHHGDHTGGNISYKGLVEHVLAHANSKLNQEKSAKLAKTEDKQLYPDHTYTNTWCERFGKEKICIYYLGPAHTNGDSVIHFEKANIVHMGDLMFNRRHPFIDRNAGASIKNWMSVLENVTNKFDNNTRYIFGHAFDGFEVTGKSEDLKIFGDYLGKLLEFVEKEIKAGKTKDEIVKTTIIPGAEQWGGNLLPQSLTAAFEELTV